MKSIFEIASVKFTKWFIFNVPGASWQQGDLKPEETQEEHKAAPVLSNLPKSGELIQYDFREKNKDDDPVAGQELKVVSYNIFLAQNLKGVIDELTTMDPPPDVILLQEDNIYELPTTETTTTTTFHHAGGAIAKVLKMSCIFVNAHYRGGEESNGLYGMSILSRYKLRNTCALKCETQPWIVNEMTNTWLKGERHFPYAEIGSSSNTIIALSSVHLPSIGKFGEKTQMMSVLFKQMKEKLKKTLSSIKAGHDDNNDKDLPIIIGGDMNTAPYFFRYILPFGSTDLFFSLKSETKLFRKFLTENNFMDPFSKNDGTFYFGGGSSVKLDWILFHQKCFNVQSCKVQPKNNKKKSTNKAAAASDHQWISVTCSLTKKEVR